jgi:hypothetical protein
MQTAFPERIMKLQIISTIVVAYSMLAAAWICNANLVSGLLPLAVHQ